MALTYPNSLLILLLIFRSCFSFLLEVKGNGIDAEAFSRRFRSVIEDVSQVSSTAGTDGLDPVHEMAGVFLNPDFVAGNHIIETGPAGPGLELGIGRKEFLPAGSTGIDSFLFVIIQIARKGPFGAFLPQDLILFRSEDLLPLFFGFLDIILCQLQTPFMHITQLYRKYYYPSVQGKALSSISQDKFLESYSYLSESTGFIFAAFLAG